jgi:hypothetical protein
MTTEQLAALKEVAKTRVKDLTYYPIMSDVDCAFRMENQKKKPSRTYHQYMHAAKRTVEGYGFCAKHAAVAIAVNEREQAS